MNYLEENLFNKNHEKCLKSSILRAFAYRLFQLVLLFTTQLPVYTLTTLKSHTEKSGEYCLVCEALLIVIDRQSVWKYFSTMFWVDSTWFLKVGLEEVTVTSLLLLFGTSLNKYWTTTKFCKIKILRITGLGNTH